jgi:hypothetical protein
MRKALFAAVAVTAMTIGASAYAAPKADAGPGDPPPCANTDVQFGLTFASSCTGFYGGNTVQDQVDAEDITYLGLLTPALTGLTVGQDFLTKLTPLSGATNLTFTGFTFYGLTYFGLHAGGGGDRPGVNSSSYYVVDYGAAGGNTLQLNINASSNIAVYSTKDKPFETPVPEPATWGMMILGFGGVGSLIRRRRTSALTA